VTVSQTQTVPAFVPKGVYQAHITATDGETGEELTCIDGQSRLLFQTAFTCHERVDHHSNPHNYLTQV
jgi:hypothetical protein